MEQDAIARGATGDLFTATADRGGPLRTAALRIASRLGQPSWPRGGDGVRALATALDDYCCERGALASAGEEELVDGLGALLGLVLIDALGGAGHVSKLDLATKATRHRIALGTHGSFDPFGAVAACIEAPSPRRELSRRIAEAEAEARGDGRVAKLVGRFVDVVRLRRPDLSIERNFDLEVELSGGIEVDLDRLRGASDDPVALGHATERLVSMLPGAPEPTRRDLRDELLERGFPRLVPESFFRALGGGDTTTGLATRPFLADVVLTLVIHHGDRARYVRSTELAEHGLSFGDAFRLAVANLAGRSTRARFERVDDDGATLVVARTGDGLDAARLVLPGLHDVLAAALGSPVVIGVPHRDTLVAAPLDCERSVACLVRRVEGDAARAPHRISARLFRLDPSSLSELVRNPS